MKEQLKATTRRMIPILAQIVQRYLPGYKIEELAAKEKIKQTLQLQSFFGENQNAVEWQIWAAMLTHLVLRYIKWKNKVVSSYTRFAAIIKNTIWLKRLAQRRRDADVRDEMRLRGECVEFRPEFREDSRRAVVADAVDLRHVEAAAAKGDYAAFAAGELSDRRDAYFPPFCRLSTLVFKSKADALAHDWADLYARSLGEWAKKVNVAAQSSVFRVSDAAEAPLSKAEGWFRYHVVLRTPTAKAAVDAVKWLRTARPAPEALRIAFDVDALNLM